MKIGIDLGGSHISVGIITEDGKILTKQEEIINASNKENIKGLIRDRILFLINYVLKEVQVPIFIVEKIGIGVPGIVENNKIIKCDKYEIYDWDLAKELEEFYKIDVTVENDAICAARGELLFGSLKETSKSVFICLGTGIGGANIINDSIMPAEYGHMTIKENGKLCNCKNKGCFEMYASMRAFKTGMIELFGLKDDISSEELLTILKNQKDNIKLNMYIDEYISNLSVGIRNIANIMNPEKICIGGSFVYFKDIVYTRLVKNLEKMNYQFEMPKIVLAELKNDAGIIGAVFGDGRKNS